MASNLFFQFEEEQDLDALANHIAKALQSRGYFVRVYPSGSGITTLEVEKDNNGIYTVIGYCKAIKANFIKNNGGLTVYFTDEAWTDKIIGLILGWFTCAIPWIFTAIGAYSQLQLPKIVEQELIAFTGRGPVPFGSDKYGPAAQTKKCEGCQSQINPSAAYCKHCGKKQ